MSIKYLPILFIVFSFPLFAQKYDLNELKSGQNKDKIIGSTSGLLSTSIDSVNSISSKQYRDSQRYSNSANNSSSDYSSSSSSSNSSRSSASSAQQSSSSQSKPLIKEIYDAGTKSSEGFKNYRVVCQSGRAKTVFQDSSGWWRDTGGSNLGERYKNLSLKAVGEKYCS